MWFSDCVFIKKLYCHIYFRVLDSCREHSYYLMLSVVVLRSPWSLRRNQNCQIMRALVRYVAFLNPHSSVLHFSHRLFVYFCEEKKKSVRHKRWDVKLRFPMTAEAIYTFWNVQSVSGFAVSSWDFKARVHEPKKTEMPLYCPRTFNGPKYKMCLGYKALFSLFTDLSWCHCVSFA